MKVTAISMVRNEADVIEAFVRHHAELLDELVVVDHRSVDGTGEILAALEAEGLPLTVRTEPALAHRQNVVTTRLMREAARTGGTDWVIPLDADEFLVAPGARPRDVLAELPDSRPSAIDMRFYVPTPDDPPDEPNVLRRLRHRREVEGGTWTRKALVPARWARNGRFSLAQGSHALVDGRTGRFAAASHVDRLALAHFPVRSPRQLARKVLGGWPAYLARPDRVDGGNPHWKRAFEVIASGRPLTPRRLQAIALDYATHGLEPGGELILDPVPSELELRYPVPSGPTPLETLAHTTVGLAEELGDELRDVRAS